MAKGGWKIRLGAALVVSAVIGTILLFPLWLHHDVRQDSPVFATKAETETWVRRFAAGEGAQCLDWARETEVIDEGFNAGWYARYRCNTKAALWRVGFGYAVPAVAVIVMSIALTPRARRRKKKK